MDVVIKRNPDRTVTAEGGTSQAHDLLKIAGFIPHSAPGRLWQSLPPGLTTERERALASTAYDVLTAAGFDVDLDGDLDTNAPVREHATTTARLGDELAALTAQLSRTTDATQIAELTAHVTDPESGLLPRLLEFFEVATIRIADTTGFAPHPDPQVDARLTQVLDAATAVGLPLSDIPATLHAIASAGMDAIASAARQAWEQTNRAAAAQTRGSATAAPASATTTRPADKPGQQTRHRH